MWSFTLTLTLHLSPALCSHPLPPPSLLQVLAIKTLQEVEPLIAAAHGPGEEGKAAAAKAHLHEGAYSNTEVGGRRRVAQHALLAGCTACAPASCSAGDNKARLLHCTHITT
jgi:hypothetical protein